MSDPGHDGTKSFEARHAAIIARTLRWADEAAARGDYTEAVRWVEIVHGSLLSRMVRELPGIDIRVVTSRAEREGLRP